MLQPRKEMTEMMDTFRAIVQADMDRIQKEQTAHANDNEWKLFLVHRSDGYSREDCNVYYSNLVRARTEAEMKRTYESKVDSKADWERLGYIIMEVAQLEEE